MHCASSLTLQIELSDKKNYPEGLAIQYDILKMCLGMRFSPTRCSICRVLVSVKKTDHSQRDKASFTWERVRRLRSSSCSVPFKETNLRGIRLASLGSGQNTEIVLMQTDQRGPGAFLDRKPLERVVHKKNGETCLTFCFESQWALS